MSKTCATCNEYEEFQGFCRKGIGGHIKNSSKQTCLDYTERREPLHLEAECIWYLSGQQAFPVFDTNLDKLKIRDFFNKRTKMVLEEIL